MVRDLAGGGSPPKQNQGKRKQRKQGISQVIPLCCTLSPHSSRGFTLPCLNGSEPLPSFVIPAQEVEADSV